MDHCDQNSPSLHIVYFHFVFYLSFVGVLYFSLSCSTEFIFLLLINFFFFFFHLFFLTFFFPPVVLFYTNAVYFLLLSLTIFVHSLFLFPYISGITKTEVKNTRSAADLSWHIRHWLLSTVELTLTGRTKIVRARNKKVWSMQTYCLLRSIHFIRVMKRDEGFAMVFKCIRK